METRSHTRFTTLLLRGLCFALGVSATALNASAQVTTLIPTVPDAGGVTPVVLATHLEYLEAETPNGLTQTLTFTRKRAASTGGCAAGGNNIEVTLLSSSTDFPGQTDQVFAESLFGGTLPELLFGGQDLETITSFPVTDSKSPIGVQSGVPFTLSLEVFDPSCQNGACGVISSDDERAVLVLLNGHNRYMKAVKKGVTALNVGDGAAQQFFEQGTSFVQLADNQALLLFETDALANGPSDPEYRFDDATMLIELPGCGEVEDVTDYPPLNEVVIRDSITSDPAYTDDNGYWSLNSSSAPLVAGVQLAASNAPKVLKKVQFVIQGPTPNQPIPFQSGYTFIFQGWRDLNAMFQDHLGGHWYTEIDGSNASSWDLWGQSFSIFGPRPTYLLEFNISKLGIVIPANEDIAFAIAGSDSAGVNIGIGESDEAAGATPEYYYNVSQFWAETTALGGSEENGRYAINIVAEEF